MSSDTPVETAALLFCFGRLRSSGVLLAHPVMAGSQQALQPVEAEASTASESCVGSDDEGQHRPGLSDPRNAEVRPLARSADRP